VIITARISPAHAPLASFIGAALALMSMAAVIVLGRRERRILDERTAALQDSEDRYRAIVDRAEGLFLATATTKELIESNHAFRALRGFAADEAAALTIYDFDADTREGVDHAIRQLLDAKRPLQLERRYRHKNGSTVEVTLNINAFVRGSQTILCGTVRD